jgi:hypothetical protein
MTNKLEIVQEIEETRRQFHSLDEADLQKSVHYPNWDPLLAGEVTPAYLFGYLKRHFDSHAADIQASLAAFLNKYAPPAKGNTNQTHETIRT